MEFEEPCHGSSPDSCWSLGSLQKRILVSLAAVGQGARGERFNRGLAIHSLLQHLPELPDAERLAAAHAFVSRPALGLEKAGEVARETLAVLNAPGLAPLFGPGSRAEQPISGVVHNRVVSGQVDRLVVLPDRILIADYKTNRGPPGAPEEVPAMYLRQMAAYRAVLEALYPDRRVICLLIYTDGPAIMPLPPALLDLHAPAREAA